MGAVQSQNNLMDVFGFAYAKRMRDTLANADIELALVSESADDIKSQLVDITKPVDQGIIDEDGNKKTIRNLAIFLDIHPDCPKDFQFDLSNESDRSAAIAALELDQRVSNLKPQLVPQKVTEGEFFKNYFSHVFALHTQFLKEHHALDKVELSKQEAIGLKNNSIESNQSKDATGANASPADNNTHDIPIENTTQENDAITESQLEVGNAIETTSTPEVKKESPKKKVTFSDQIESSAPISENVPEKVNGFTGIPLPPPLYPMSEVGLYQDLNVMLSFSAGGGQPQLPQANDLARAKTLERVRKLTMTDELKKTFQVFRDIHPTTPLWFKFSLSNHSDREAAMFAMKIDSKISEAKSQLVPKEMPEDIFFFNYFSHIHAIRESIVETPHPIPNTNEKRINLSETGMLDSKSDLVLVASTNQVKVNACRKAFEECFPNRNFRFVGISAESNVSDQPKGDKETYMGAVNRVNYVLAEATRNPEYYDVAFVVGLEGGIRSIARKEAMKSIQKSDPPSYEQAALLRSGPSMPSSGKVECFAWIAIYSTSTENWGTSRSASFVLPEAVNFHLRQGRELGHADAIVFDRYEPGKQDGTVGLLTKGAITRTDMYAHAAIMALVPFLHVHLYAEATPTET